MSEILVNTIKKADGTGSITVPAETGTVLTSASSIPVANLDSAVGITEVDIWKITTAKSGTGFLTANWERVTDDGAGYLGTGMTESSGVFTFPSTGIWRIDAPATMYRSNGNEYYVGYEIYTSTDGTNYDSAAKSQGSVTYIAATNVFESAYCTFIFDVTNTSTHKVKFHFLEQNDGTIEGSTNKLMTGGIFTRLGDT